MYYQHANLLSFLIQSLGHSASSVTAGAHSYDDVFSIGSAIIVEQMILTTSDLRNLGHIFLYHSRNCFIVGVNSLTSLEINIRILRATTLNRIVRIQGTLTEGIHSLLIQQLIQILVIHNLNLLDFVGGTEAIEEVQEGHAALNCSQMSHSGQVHNLLYRGFSQHSKACLTASHNVLMITKNIQGAGGQSASGNMENTGQQFTGNFIHVRNH